jgi:hypothetical protein
MTGGRTLFRTRRRNVWCQALGLACLTSFAFVTSVVLPLTPASGDAAPVAHLLDLVNQDRAQHSLGPVALSPGLSAIAQVQANAMAAARRIYQNPAFPGNVPAAGASGENVGYGPDVDRVHAAFVASPEHQVIIVGSAYRYVGIAVASSPVGLMVVENFVDTPGKLAPPPPPPPPPAPAPHPPVWKAPPPPQPAAVVHAAAVPAVPVQPAPPPAAQAAPASVAPAAAPPPPPPPPTFDVALYARMLRWDLWQTSTTAGN